jgi:hypothetical protein
MAASAAVAGVDAYLVLVVLVLADSPRKWTNPFRRLRARTRAEDFFDYPPFAGIEAGPRSASVSSLHQPSQADEVSCPLRSWTAGSCRWAWLTAAEGRSDMAMLNLWTWNAMKVSFLEMRRSGIGCCARQKQTKAARAERRPIGGRSGGPLSLLRWRYPGLEQNCVLRVRPRSLSATGAVSRAWSRRRTPRRDIPAAHCRCCGR